eukprot:scaffold209353_cov18-Tisochrysis_lutea.AAC.1
MLWQLKPTQPFAPIFTRHPVKKEEEEEFCRQQSRCPPLKERHYGVESLMVQYSLLSHPVS